MQQEYYEVTEADFACTEEEMYEIAGTGLAAIEEIKEAEALEAIFKKECFASEFSDMPWYAKAFYWFKTLVCLCFKWYNGSYLNDSFPIVYWNEYGGHEGGSNWDACWIEAGIFTNWKVCIMSDSSY